jgi:two-component SAPR family response regulator
MKIIAVDDEQISLEGLLDIISEAAPTAELAGFEYPEDALEYVDEHDCNIAFLDIEMAEMSGVELAQKLKLRNPDVNIIFSTGYGHYRDAVFDLHASSYLTKPITPEKVKKELDNLRRPIRNPKRIRIRAFGNFEAYLDGNSINFKYSNTKEMLAYLIDRAGSSVTTEQLAVALWED